MRDEIAKRIFDELPDTSAFEDLPQAVVSNSAPAGGKPRLTRRSSKMNDIDMGVPDIPVGPSKKVIRTKFV